MKKRILTLLEVEGLSVLIWLLDARIWLLKRIIRLTEASISAHNRTRTENRVTKPWFHQQKGVFPP